MRSSPPLFPLFLPAPSLSSSDDSSHLPHPRILTAPSLILPPRSGVRPFGVSLLVAGFDNARGHTLYQVDPSGSFWAWKASAIGKNQVNAKTFLEKRYVFPVPDVVLLTAASAELRSSFMIP